MKLSTIKRRFNKEFKWVTYPNPLIKAAPRIWAFILEYFEPKSNQVEALVSKGVSQPLQNGELLPCPFCGSEVDYIDMGMKRVHIACPNCIVIMAKYGGQNTTKKVCK